MKGGWLAWLQGVAAVGAAGLAAAQLENVADAAHDAGVGRALGLDPQPWGSLDAPVAALLSWVPVGTLAVRAAMGQALVLGLAAAVLSGLAHRLLVACADAPRISRVVAVIATWCAVLGPAWQLEGASPAGSTLGALLALAPLALLADADGEGAKPPWRLAVLVLGLALGQDLLAGLVSLAACAALVGAGRSARQRFVVAWWSEWRALVACALAGLLPLVIAIARTRASGGSLLDALLPGAAERGLSGTGAPWLLVQRELGVVMVVLAVFGAVLALLVVRARGLGAALVVVTGLGLSCGWAGAALGPTRFGAPVLAAMAAACLLAGVSMQALVRAIAEAKLPLSRASAAMVLVLELVAPVDAADDALRRGAERARGAGMSPESPAGAWDDTAWGTLPPRSIVLVTDARIWRRASRRARDRLAPRRHRVVPTFAHGTLAARFLSRDAALVPLWRDSRAVGRAHRVAAVDARAGAAPADDLRRRWGKALGKHLVPSGLFDRFEPEPPGHERSPQGARGVSAEARAPRPRRGARPRARRRLRVPPAPARARHGVERRPRSDWAARWPTSTRSRPETWSARRWCLTSSRRTRGSGQPRPSLFFSRDSSRARHMYQAPTVRKGFQRSPCFASSFGVGILRLRYVSGSRRGRRSRPPAARRRAPGGR